MRIFTDELKKLLWNLPKHKVGADLLSGKVIFYRGYIVYFCGDNYWVTTASPFIDGDLTDFAVDYKIFSGLLSTYNCDLVLTVDSESVQIQKSMFGNVPQIEKGVSIPCVTDFTLPNCLIEKQQTVDEIVIDQIHFANKSGYIFYFSDGGVQYVLDALTRSQIFYQKLVSQVVELSGNDVHVSIFESLLTLQEHEHVITCAVPSNSFTVLQATGKYTLNVFIRQSESFIFTPDKVNPKSVVASMNAMLDDDRLWFTISEEFLQTLQRWKHLTTNFKVEEIEILIKPSSITLVLDMKQWSDKIEIDCTKLLAVYDVKSYLLTIKADMLKQFNPELHNKIGFTPTNSGDINMVLFSGNYTIAFSTEDGRKRHV